MDLSKSYEFFQPNKDNAAIHIIGCGSVGSTVAENLARMGIDRFVLWDFDIVEPHNIVNQMFVNKDIGKNKVDALKDIIMAINPDIPEENIRLKNEGWNGQKLSGYVFLCVDSIEIRQKIVDTNFYEPNVKAMFDFRTRLVDAQHYAADWSDDKMKSEFRDSMNFTHDEAKAETPVSACNVTLGVCPTVRVICAYGVANFINFVNTGNLKKMILSDAFCFDTLSF